MSAITGIIHFNDEPIPIEHGNGLMQALKKFPADDVQTWRKDNVFLGCHAQWITPESVGEQLPFYDYQRQLAITADAIIDNREELFERLQVHREDRKKITDSQLILLAYEKWGEESPKFLVGDFAYMIWDEKERKLFGARDFSGGRTLYYYKDYYRLAFCTTIEPLFSLPYIDRNLNEQWLAEYLVVEGMIDAVDASITPFQSVYQVPPSHSISIVGNTIRYTRYCTLTSETKLKLNSNEEYIEAFKEIFQEAITSRLRTFRGVGSHLSGGLDSGSVVSFAAEALRNESKTLHTFSYIPPNDFKDFTPKRLIPDERPLIRSTVNHVGGIKDYYLDFNGRDSYSEIDSFIRIMEMPYKFFENSFWLKGIFEKAHEKGIGVLLSGDRGNFTISWGFAPNYYAILLKKLKWITLYQELDQYSKNTGGPRFRSLPYIARLGFPFINSIFPNEIPYKLPRLIKPEFAERTGVFQKLKRFGIDQSGWYPTSNIYEERRKHFEDVFQWNAGSTLSTKLSLRYSLWKRDPTNDIRLVRYCLSLPENQYVQKGLDRALIRLSTKGYLPDEIRLNQSTRGVQGADWVHRMIPKWDQFVKELKQLSTDKEILEYLDAGVIKKALLKVESGVRPEHATDPNYKILMRSLIVFRFIKTFT